MTYVFTSKILIIFEEHFSKIRCIKGHFSFGRNTNGRCPFLLSGIVIIHFDDMQKINPFTYLPNKMSIWSVIERVWGDPHQDKSHRITGCQTAILLNMGGSCSNLQTLLHIQKMEGENTGCERKEF